MSDRAAQPPSPRQTLDQTFPPSSLLPGVSLNLNVQTGNEPLDFNARSLKARRLIGHLYDGKGVLGCQALKAKPVHPRVDRMQCLPSRGRRSSPNYLETSYLKTRDVIDAQSSAEVATRPGTTWEKVLLNDSLAAVQQKVVTRKFIWSSS